MALNFMTRRIPVAAAAAACLLPDVAVAQKRFVAPTDKTIFLEYQEGYGSTPVQIAYLTNLSSVQIVVYSVTLRNCENVRFSCSPQKVNIKVAPGQRVALKRVEAKRPDESFRFSLSFGWRADSSSAEALRFLAESGSQAAKNEIEVREAANEERQATVGIHDEWLDRERLAVIGDTLASLESQPDSVVLRVGQSFALRQVRLIARASDGALLGRVSGAYQFRASNRNVEARADTIIARAPGRAEIEFRLAAPAPARSAKLTIVVTPDSSGLHERHR